MNPFVRKKPNPKRTKPRRVGNGRVRLRGEKMTDLRWKAFERSGGRCEMDKLVELPSFDFTEQFERRRCYALITWESMELCHEEHGPRKSDELSRVKAGCKECHRNQHNPKSCKRRPGKPMSKKHAETYWNGAECFCEKEPKRPRESFGPECRAKVSPATLHTLENTDDPEVYRETLAQAEIEILKYSIEQPFGAAKGSK